MVRLLAKTFPSLASDLRDETWRGLTHIEMARFARHAQARIDDGERQELERCFCVADRLLSQGDPTVKNAVAVSYLEHLNFTDGKRPRSWALTVLTPALHRELRAVTGRPMGGSRDAPTRGGEPDQGRPVRFAMSTALDRLIAVRA